MKAFSIGLIVFFLIVLFIYLIIASNRKTIKNVYCLVTNIITFIMAFVITRLIISLFGNNFISPIVSRIEQGLKIVEEEWINNTSIELVTRFLAAMIIGLFGFMVIFIILFVFNHLLKRFIFKTNMNISYGKYKAKKKDNKFVNLVIGLCSFTIITFAFAYPLGTLFKIVIDSAKTVNYKFPDNVEMLLKNPVVKLYANDGSEYFFNQVTKSQNKDNDIKTTQELKSATTIVLAVVDVNEKDHVKQNIKIIKEEFEKTYIVPTFISELCSNAALRWKDNKSFMGYKLEIPKDNSKEVYMDLLDIVSKWDRESLLNDVDTIYEFYRIINDYGILKSENSDELFNALTKDEFNEELFLCLFGNEDFRSVIATFMDYGLKTMFAKYDVKLDIQYVDIAELMKLSDEDIKKEARIFALTLRQFGVINDAMESGSLSKKDYNDLINNLSKIKESKLLNNSVYKLLNRLLAQI